MMMMMMMMMTLSAVFVLPIYERTCHYHRRHHPIADPIVPSVD
jgi:hypothetical protein